MIESMSDLPDHVLGFKALGRLSGQDCETTIIPSVLVMTMRLKHVRMLYQLAPEFEGFEAKAMLDDAMLGVSRYTAWDRVAVVTDEAWVRVGVRTLHFAMHRQFRLFHVAELSDAKFWLSESPALP